MITEPQQTAWVRCVLLKLFEEAHGKPLANLLLKSHDCFDEPLTYDSHPHLFQLRKL